MVIFDALEALSGRLTQLVARRRHRQTRVDAERGAWPLMYSSPTAPDAPATLASTGRDAIPARPPAEVSQNRANEAVSSAAPVSSSRKLAWLRSKRLWAAAALATLLLMGGARYGLEVWTQKTEADSRETGIVDMVGGQGADDLAAKRTQQFYDSLLGDSTELDGSSAEDDYQPVLLKRVEPKYPAAARQAGVEGLVVVTYAIDARGKPKDLTVTKSVPMLDDAVIAALRQWEYTPPPSGSTAHRYRCNAEFVLGGSAALASSALP